MIVHLFFYSQRLYLLIVMEEDSRARNGKNTYPSVRDFIKQTSDLLRDEEKYEIALFEEMTKHKTIA